MKHGKVAVCARCGTPVTPSFVDGYAYYCPEDDEFLTSLEVGLKTIEEVKRDGKTEHLFDFIRSFLNNIPDEGALEVLDTLESIYLVHN